MRSPPSDLNDPSGALQLSISITHHTTVFLLLLMAVRVGGSFFCSNFLSQCLKTSSCGKSFLLFLRSKVKWKMFFLGGFSPNPTERPSVTLFSSFIFFLAIRLVLQSKTVWVKTRGRIGQLIGLIFGVSASLLVWCWWRKINKWD